MWVEKCDQMQKCLENANWLNKMATSGHPDQSDQIELMKNAWKSQFNYGIERLTRQKGFFSKIFCEVAVEPSFHHVKLWLIAMNMDDRFFWGSQKPFTWILRHYLASRPYFRLSSANGISCQYTVRLHSLKALFKAWRPNDLPSTTWTKTDAGRALEGAQV